MAVKKTAAGKNLPLSQATTRIAKRAILYISRGQLVAQSWNTGHKRPPTAAELQQRAEFKQLVQATKNVMPDEAVAAREIATNSKYTWRDVLSRMMVGRLTELGNYGELVSQYNLDILGDQAGMIVIRNALEWIALPIGAEDEVLIVTDGLPAWGTAGITELTGPVTGGPGAGAIATTIEPTGVTPGMYDFATVTVGADGRLTSAAAGTPPSGITQLTGPVTGGPGSGSIATAITPTGVTPGTYNFSTVTIGADGRITSAATGTPPSGITQLTGPVTGGPGSGSVPTAITATGVTPGAYSLANITVGADGRVTAAADGAAAGTGTIAHPGFVSGRWYTRAMSVALSQVSMIANRIYAVPLFVPFATTFTKMGAFIGTIAGGNLEFGVYDNINGVPVNLVHDCGSIASATTNTTYQIAGRTIILPAGYYWLAMAASATPSARSTAATDLISANETGSPTGPAGLVAITGLLA